MTDTTALAVAAATRCNDTRCTDGITWCAPCRGHGVLNPKGKPYKNPANIPSWAKPHAGCNGTGLLACGCTPLDDAARALLAATAA